MAEPENTTNESNALGSQRKKLGPLWFAGIPLMIFGIVVSVMYTMNHLKQQPPEPIDFDMTLQHGDGGFIVYGVAVAVFGLILMLIGVRRKGA